MQSETERKITIEQMFSLGQSANDPYGESLGWERLVSNLSHALNWYNAIYVRGSNLATLVDVSKESRDANHSIQVIPWFFQSYRSAVEIFANTCPDLQQFLKESFSLPNIDLYITVRDNSELFDVERTVENILQKIASDARLLSGVFPVPEWSRMSIADGNISLIQISFGSYHTRQVNIVIKRFMGTLNDASAALSRRQVSLRADLVRYIKHPYFVVDTNLLSQWSEEDEFLVPDERQDLSVRSKNLQLLAAARTVRFNVLFPPKKGRLLSSNTVDNIRVVVERHKHQVPWPMLGKYVHQFAVCYLHNPIGFAQIIQQLGPEVFPNINFEHLQERIITLTPKYLNRKMILGPPIYEDIEIDDLVLALYGAESIQELLERFPEILGLDSKADSLMDMHQYLVDRNDRSSAEEHTDWILKDKRLFAFLLLAFLPVLDGVQPNTTSFSPQPAQSD